MSEERCHFQKFSDNGIAKDCILLPACDFVCQRPIKILDFLFARMVIIGLGRNFFLFTKKNKQRKRAEQSSNLLPCPSTISRECLIVK